MTSLYIDFVSSVTIDKIAIPEKWFGKASFKNVCLFASSVLYSLTFCYCFFGSPSKVTNEDDNASPTLLKDWAKHSKSESFSGATSPVKESLQKA